MYKVLIADDEEIICRGLAGMVSHHPELQVVALAEDGEIAFEKAKELRPDLMIVDINMPFLNGLGFVEKIRQVLSDVVIIIVTGYDDFEFVQKALQLGVLDYVLKPIMENTFFEVLDKAVSKLRGLDKSKKFVDWLVEQMEQNLPNVLNDFFYNWLNGRIGEEEAEEQMRYLKIQIPSHYWITVMHLIKDYSRDVASYSDDGNDDPLHIECCNIVKTCFSPYSETIFFQTEDGDLAVISKVLPEQQWEELKQKLDLSIEESLCAKLELTQKQGESIEEIPVIYKQLLEESKDRRHYSDAVIQAISIINKQWGSSELSLQSVADALYVSAPYLSKLFSKETGENFASYLTRKRINEAMWLLKNTNLKMYEIAQKTGYTSQHYFSNIFKKALGISPVDYRKNFLNEEI